VTRRAGETVGCAQGDERPRALVYTTFTSETNANVVPTENSEGTRTVLSYKGHSVEVVVFVRQKAACRRGRRRALLREQQSKRTGIRRRLSRCFS